MSYEPTNWKAGDTITSAKLNKIEQGIGGAVSFVHMIIEEVESENNGNIEGTRVKPINSGDSDENNNSSQTIVKLDKTYEELENAFENGLVLLIRNQEENNGYEKALAILSYCAYHESQGCVVVFLDIFHNSEAPFFSNSPTEDLIYLDLDSDSSEPSE